MKTHFHCNTIIDIKWFTFWSRKRSKPLIHHVDQDVLILSYTPKHTQRSRQIFLSRFFRTLLPKHTHKTFTHQTLEVFCAWSPI